MKATRKVKRQLPNKRKGTNLASPLHVIWQLRVFTNPPVKEELNSIKEFHSFENLR